MSLILYGGGHYQDNFELNKRLLASTPKRSPKITYIPASSDFGLEDFREFVEAIENIRSCKFVYFPIDYEITTELKTRAFQSDIIFLSGGNTFGFLSNIKKHGLERDLRLAHQKGKMIAGVSAGAILLTPNIRTASYPEFDRDENFVGLRSTKSLSLVPFEFFPHYMNSSRYKRELLRQSSKTKRSIIASTDSSGIVVHPSGVEFIGCHYLFNSGNQVSLPRPTNKALTNLLL